MKLGILEGWSKHTFISLVHFKGLIQVVILEWVQIFLGRNTPRRYQFHRNVPLTGVRSLGWVTGNDPGAPLVKGGTMHSDQGLANSKGEKITTYFTHNVCKLESPTLTGEGVCSKMGFSWPLGPEVSSENL